MASMGQHPCMNQNCHSYGRPHPNCKCYGYAYGGRVKHFCSSGREHDSKCKYYMAKGGEAVPSFDEMPDESKKESVPDFDSMPDESKAQKAMNFDEMPDESQKYSSTEQKLKTAAEGFAQGIAGPLATLAETKLFGVKPEDIKGRKEANPAIHGASEVGGFLLPVSGVGKVAGAVGKLAKVAGLGEVGTMAIRGAIESSSFAMSDEMTKAMLSQPGSDPEAPASAALLHVGAAGLVGAVSGGVFSFGEKMIGKATTPEMMKRLDTWLAKVGEAKDPLHHLGLKDKIISTATKSVAGTAGAAAATKMGPLAGLVVYEQVQKALSEPISRALEKRVNPYVTNAAIKAILTNKSGVSNAVHYATNIASGMNKVAKGMDALFKAGGSQIAEPVGDEAANFLKEFIDQGQVDTQLQNSMVGESEGFAKGGEVSEKSNAFSSVFPEQNMLLSAAKGRVSTYLNSIRPLKNVPKLAFDNESQQTQKKRSYDRAINIAVNPLSILDSVNKGNLTMEDVQHFRSLYPEVHRYLSKEMTKKITEAQLKKEKPPYKKRQAMSLFLGADLDSTFTPQSISTIQGIYASKAAQQTAPASKTKAIAKSSNAYLTDSGARIRRSQNAKA